MKNWKAIFIISGIFFVASRGFAAPSGLTLQGRLVKDNVAVTGAVTLTVSVTSPNADLCLLYEETHNFTLSATDEGIFSVKIGGGTRTVNDKGLAIVDVFSNTGSAINALSCSGSAATSYTPSASDSRYVYLSFSTTVGTVAFTDPYVVQSVPYALEAERLAGRTSSQYLQTITALEGTPGTTQTRVSRVFDTDYALLDALLNGTSTQYMTSSATEGTTLPVLTGNPATLSAGKIWYDGGSLKYYDGVSTSVKTLGTASGSGTVTSVATGTGLTGGPVTTTGTISLASGVIATPGTYQSVTVDTYGRVTAGTSPTTAGGYGITDAVIKGGQAGALVVGTSDGNSLTLNTNNTARMTVLSGGNVGIGTASPDKLLTFSSGVSNQTIGVDDTGLYLSRTSDGTYNASITRDSTGTVAAVNIGYNTVGGRHVFNRNGLIMASIGNSSTAVDASGVLSIRALTSTTAVTGLSNSPINITSDDASGGVSGIIFNRTNRTSAGSNAISVWQYNATELARMTTEGNLGIGTASPVAQLEVQKNSSGATVDGLILSNRTATAVNTGVALHFVPNGAAGVTRAATIESVQSTSGSYADLRFYTALGNHSEKMRIDPTGNIGIGTTAPGRLLHVNGPMRIAAAALPGTPATGDVAIDSGDSNKLKWYNGSGWQTAGGSGDFMKDGSVAMTGTLKMGDNAIYGSAASGGDLTLDSTTDATKGDVFIAPTTGNVGVGTTNPGFKFEISDANNSIQFRMRRTGTSAAFADWGVDSVKGISFWPDGYGTTSTNPKIVFNPNGDVGVGTTTPGYKLDVNGDIRIANASSLYIGTTAMCDNTGCTAAPSDVRYKKNIEPLENSLENVLKLQGVGYDWKDQEQFNDKHQIGFIAQDLEQVYPEVVKTDKKTGFKSVMYDKLVAPLVEAFKALVARLNDTDGRVAALEAENAAKGREISSVKMDNEQLKKENAAIKARLDQIEKTLTSK